MRAIPGVLSAAVLLGACETQDCPDPDILVGGSLSLDVNESKYFSECEVLGIDGEQNKTLDVLCAVRSLSRMTLRVYPDADLPIAAGQKIRVTKYRKTGSVHVEVDDSATGAPLIREITQYNGTDPAPLDQLDFPPFTFGNELACRPVPGTRGDVPLAFDVTLGDETVRMFGHTSVRLGNYMLWISTADDGHKHMMYFVMP